MNNKEISEILREVGACYEILDKNRFRSVAYLRVADTIEHLSEDINYLYEKGKISEIPSVGKNIAGYLTELLTSKQVKHFNALKKKFPKAFFTLMKLPGFGSKTAYKLTNVLNITDKQNALNELEKAVLNHRISAIEGFGEKSEKDILLSIQKFKQKQDNKSGILLVRAKNIAGKYLEYLKMSEWVIEAHALGSLRRGKEMVGDIDIAVASNKPIKAIEHFIAYPQVASVIEKGVVAATVLLKNNLQIDLMVEPSQSFGALLQHFTGSKQHNIKLREIAIKKGMSLSEHGIKTKTKMIQIKNEQEFYQKIGMQWIPPELREDHGEIEAAQKKALPKLIELSDIKGDLHLHSNYNLKPAHDMGENSFQEIIHKAQAKKYQYVGFSEHNPSKKNTLNEIMLIMKARKLIIDKLKYSTKSTRVNIFNMLEIDILSDGSLALPDSVFEFIDAAIVSIHSSFNINQNDMTKRVLRGLAHPKVKIFAHPTTRLLGEREQIKLDWQAVFDYCKDHSIALEINSSPYRLDLPDDLIKKAIDNGNKLVINSDAHRISDMDLINYGVNQARRGWSQKYAILNTLEYNEIRKWLTG